MKLCWQSNVSAFQYAIYVGHNFPSRSEERRVGKEWKQCQTLFFWGSRVTADSDCSHEIKRRLLLGRIFMTKLESILKSRDITLPTKVCLVKAIVFPVVMYGCESWTVKKAECEELMLLNCGVGEDA